MGFTSSILFVTIIYMIPNPEIKLPGESDPDLKKIKDILTGQEEGSLGRQALSDCLDESTLQIQIALLNIMYGRIKSEPGSEEIKNEFTKAIEKSGNDLTEVRDRVKTRSTIEEYWRAYTQVQAPAIRYIDNNAEKTISEKPSLTFLGRAISGREGDYEARLIAKFGAIENIRKVNKITTFINNINKPAVPK